MERILTYERTSFHSYLIHSIGGTCLLSYIGVLPTCSALTSVGEYNSCNCSKLFPEPNSLNITVDICKSSFYCDPVNEVCIEKKGLGQNCSVPLYSSLNTLGEDNDVCGDSSAFPFVDPFDCVNGTCNWATGSSQ